MAAAVLTIDINARLAKLEDGLKSANRQLSGFRSTVDGLGNGLKNALAGVTIGAAVTKFALLTKAAIDGADHLNDLSKATGVAVVTLGGIGFAAKQAGTDLETIAPQLGKLNVEIAKAAAGNPQAAASFQAMGISVKDSNGQIKDAGQILVELAGKFETYRDGPNKAALANELFKKGFQSLIPLLDEGSESLRQNIAYFEKYSGLTPELAQKADKFNDELAKANLLSDAWFRTLAADLLPSMQGLVNALVDAKEKNATYNSTAHETAEVIKNLAIGTATAVFYFDSFGRAIGVAAARLQVLAHGNFSLFSQLGDEEEKDYAERKKRFDDFVESIRNPKPDTGPSLKKKTTIEAPSLPDTQSAQRLLQAQIKALEQQVGSEEKLLSDREHFLTAYYQDDEIGIRDYFTARQTAIDEALEHEAAAYDSEIALLKKSAAAAAGIDRAKLEVDIQEAIRKRAEVEERAASRSTDNWFQARSAIKGFRDEIEQTSVRLLQLQGDNAAAAVAAFQVTNAHRLATIQGLARSPVEEDQRLAAIAQAQYDRELGLVGLTADLTKQTDEYSRTLAQVGIAQDRVNLLQQSGAVTTIDSINLQADAVRKYLPVLQQEIDAYEALAKTFPAGSPAQAEALLKVQQMRLEVDKLAASADALAGKFRDVFVNSFSDAFTDFATGAKKGKDILNDLVKSLDQQISRIASQNIAEYLFGKEGPLGSVPGFFAKLFGGKAADTTGAAALSGAGTTLTTAGTGLITAATQLNAAASALLASSGLGASQGALFSVGGLLGTSGAPGFENPFLSGFGIPTLPGFATGSDFVPRDMIAVVHRGEAIIPAALNKSGRASDRASGGHTFNVSLNITVPRGTTSATANQIGLQAARHLQRAAARIG